MTAFLFGHLFHGTGLYYPKSCVICICSSYRPSTFPYLLFSFPLELPSSPTALFWRENRQSQHLQRCYSTAQPTISIRKNPKSPSLCVSNIPMHIPFLQITHLHPLGASLAKSTLGGPPYVTFTSSSTHAMARIESTIYCPADTGVTKSTW